MTTHRIHLDTGEGNYIFIPEEKNGFLFFKPEDQHLFDCGPNWTIGYVFENGIPNENIKPEKIEDLKIGMEMTLFCTSYVDAWTKGTIEKIEQVP